MAEDKDHVAAHAERLKRFEEAAGDTDDGLYVLRLYVAGMTPRSTRAIANLKALCEDRLQGRYQLEVIDIQERPELARSDDIVAGPTLVKRLPMPLRRLIGDLSDTEHVLIGLGLERKSAEQQGE
jgi:circadian clock protein KaiB